MRHLIIHVSLNKDARNLQLFTRRPELAFNPFFDSTSAGIKLVEYSRTDALI